MTLENCAALHRQPILAMFSGNTWESRQAQFVMR